MTGISGLELAAAAVGSAILHSLWQGALIGSLTALTLWLLRGGAPTARYAVSCFALAMLLVAWLATAVGYANRAYAEYAVTTTGAGPSSAIAVPENPAEAMTSLPLSASVSVIAWNVRLESWSRSIVPLWLIGVLALSTRLAVGWLFVIRIRRLAQRQVGGGWQERVSAIARALEIARPVSLAQSALVQVPMLIGWLKPVVLIPASVLSGLSTAQLEAVIAHELAHVRRHDYFANIVQTAIEILLFYHPASWWISRQVRIEREHCCDDLAVGVCGDRILYAEALADLETLRSGVPAFGLAATDGLLVRRIRRLVGVAPVRNSSPAWMAAAAPVTALVLVVLSTSIGGTAESENPRPQNPVSAEAPLVAGDEGAVQGQVVDARSGRPVPAARVVFSRTEKSWTVSTDDEGRYDVRRLIPGSYDVEVTAPGYVPARYGQREATERASTVEVRGGQHTNGINVRLEPAGVVTGHVFDDRGEGLAGVEIELLADRYLPDGVRPVGVGFAQTEAQGEFSVKDVLPGDYYVRAYVPSSVRPSRAAVGQAYVATFYPGVTRSDYGQRLHLSSGQELFGIDFALAAAPTRGVSGIVIDPGESPRPRTRVQMRAIGLNSIDAQHQASVDADGRFKVSDVVPGDYIIYVFEPGSMTARWVSSTRFITVDDDVVDLELRPQPGARVTGRIVRDPFSIRTLDPAGVSVVFEHRMSESRWGLAWTGINARGNGTMGIGADGRFSLESPGGMVRISVSALPDEWTLKAINLDSTDITDQVVDLGQRTRQIEIVLTDRVTTVRGSVRDRSGRLAGDGSVIVFADTPTLWGESTRFVREIRPGRDGQFSLTGMPAADYLAVAIEQLPNRAWMNPDVLNRLRPLATRFNLQEGEEQVVSLRLSPPLDGLIPAQ